jgi:hypothetical protein
MFQPIATVDIGHEVYYEEDPACRALWWVLAELVQEFQLNCCNSVHHTWCILTAGADGGTNMVRGYMAVRNCSGENMRLILPYTAGSTQTVRKGMWPTNVTLRYIAATRQRATFRAPKQILYFCDVHPVVCLITLTYWYSSLTQQIICLILKYWLHVSAVTQPSSGRNLHSLSWLT